MINITIVEEKVRTLLETEGSGHDWEHIRRVTATARKLAEQEGADIALVVTVALLHDVDDRKITGDDTSEDLLPQAMGIMQAASATAEECEIVKNIIKSLGYHKSLAKIEPQTLEGKIVSDADYLDAIGAIGIARAFAFGGSRKELIFVPHLLPQDITDKDVYVKGTGTKPTINHFFEKLFNLSAKMYSFAGKQEAQRRHEFMVGYLVQLFEEVEAPPAWSELLKKHTP